MECTFIVSIKGDWMQGDRHVTPHDVEKALRERAKSEFEFLANSVTVKRHPLARELKSATDGRE